MMNLTISEAEKICIMWDERKFDELERIFNNVTWNDSTEYLTNDLVLSLKLLFYANVLSGNGLEVWKVLHRYGSYAFSELYVDLSKAGFPELYNKNLSEPVFNNTNQSEYNTNKFDGGFSEIAELYNSIERCNGSHEKVHNYIKNLIFDVQVNGNDDALFKLAYLQANNFQKYNDAIDSLQRTIILNPNKALYWGYLSIFGVNIKISPEIGLYYIERAIKLDPTNMLWHLFRLIHIRDYCIKKYNSSDYSIIDEGLYTVLGKEFNYINRNIDNNNFLYDSFQDIYKSLLDAFGENIKIWLKIENKNESNHNIHWPIYSKIAGVTYDNRQEYLQNCLKGDILNLVRDKNNPYDANAIRIYKGNLQLGFIKKDLAETLAPIMDNGENLMCTLVDITGGDDYLYGANIKIDLGKNNIKTKNDGDSIYDIWKNHL